METAKIQARFIRVHIDGELEIVRQVRVFVGVVAARVDLCAAGF